MAIWEKKREVFLGDQKKKVLCEKYNVWFTFLAQETNYSGSGGGGGDGCGGDKNGNGGRVEGSGRGGAKDLMQALMNPIRNI